MKRTALTLSFVLLASGVVAQSRIQTPRLSCGQARQIVASRGAAVLGTGGFTYDRFVLHRGFCLNTEFIEPAWVPAADTPQCFVGYRCRTDPVDEFFDR
jgi:hypothetical protein